MRLTGKDTTVNETPLKMSQFGAKLMCFHFSEIWTFAAKKYFLNYSFLFISQNCSLSCLRNNVFLSNNNDTTFYCILFSSPFFSEDQKIQEGNEFKVVIWHLPILKIKWDFLSDFQPLWGYKRDTEKKFYYLNCSRQIACL